jgi:hypothetical protein
MSFRTDFNERNDRKEDQYLQLNIRKTQYCSKGIIIYVIINKSLFLTLLEIQ